MLAFFEYCAPVFSTQKNLSFSLIFLALGGVWGGFLESGGAVADPGGGHPGHSTSFSINFKLFLGSPGPPRGTLGAPFAPHGAPWCRPEPLF